MHRYAAAEAKTSELSTALVDRLVAVEEEQEEAMDWDDVDPGLIEELQDCRRNLKEDDGSPTLYFPDSR